MFNQCRGCGAGAMSRAQDEVSTDFLRSCQGQNLVASEIVLFDIMKWVCLKIGYIPNYSHLIGIMISKTIGFRGTQFSDTPK